MAEPACAPSLSVSLPALRPPESAAAFLPADPAGAIASSGPKLGFPIRRRGLWSRSAPTPFTRQPPRAAEVRLLSMLGAAYGTPVDFLMLVEPRPAGPVLGYFRDHPIAAAVVDCFGRHYAFAGIAPRRANGRYDVDALAKGERLMEPGLVYRDESVTGDRRRHRNARWTARVRPWYRR